MINVRNRRFRSILGLEFRALNLFRISDFGFRTLPPDRLELLPRHSAELKGHGGDFDDGSAVGIHDGVSNRVGFRPEAEFLDRNLVSGDLRGLNNLTPTFEPAGNTRNWLPGNVLFLADPAHA